MANLPPGVALRRHDGAAAAQLIDQLADVYADARAEPPYDSHPRWQAEQFTTRTRNQTASSGFLLVTADAGNEIVGFAFGRPIEPHRWFEGDSVPPAEVLAAAKFAVIELNVRKNWRRRGIGRALLDHLLARRPEAYGMLSTLPNTPAHAMYERLGWRQVATTLPDSGLPPWYTLVLPLPTLG